MKKIDLIRWAMQFTDAGIARLVADMRDAALVQPTANGGNHALWNLGHLAFVEGSLRSVILGEKSPVEHWGPLFGIGSQPTTNASDYPPFDEILNTLRELRAHNLKLLDEIGEEALDQKPKFVPPGFEDAMQTVGHVFLLISLHEMVHYGEIAVARRAAGRKPLM